MVECVCRAARGSPDHLLTPLIIPQKCPNRSGNIRLLRAVGRLQRRSRGLAYISIALLSEIQQRVSTRATPRRSCQHSLLFFKGGVLMRSWERKQWYRVERSKTLCITVARQHFKSVLAPLTQAHFQLHSESLVCDPLWYAYYFLLLDAELSGLQHQYTLSLSQAASLWVSPFLCRNAKSDGARPSPRGQRWAEAKWMN